ncbi:TY-Chap2 family putative peptide chaperone [Kocuria turfanensis]|uniref:TY-Chap2 family putative peptide chaperone n=1 Tax=Kocuria turfanensis TaxID=388357 RepID=UPI00403528B2
MKLTGPQQDRAAGLLVGLAVGDTHRRRVSDRQSWGMTTSTMLAALDVLARSPGVPLPRLETVQERMTQARIEAMLSSEDTDWVASMSLAPLAMASAVALATLGQQTHRTFELAQVLVGETFEDDLAIGCGVWSVMLAEAVRSGEACFQNALAPLSKPDRLRWAGAIAEAQGNHPMDIGNGNLGLQLVQKAWAIASFAQHTPGPRRFIRNVSPEALEYYRAGPAAPLVGAVLGTTRGFSAIPFAWRRDLTGAAGGTADELMRRAITAAFGDDLKPNRWPNVTVMDYSMWPARNTAVTHPVDEGVHLGGVGALEAVAPSAAVSLCRLGTAQRPASVEERDHAAFWLVDSDKPEDNPNLSFVLEDAADTVKMFRAESKRVLVHCVQAQSRTPVVGALYGRLVTGDSAVKQLKDIVGNLPPTKITGAFLRELKDPRHTRENDPNKGVHNQDLARHAIELVSWSVAAELLRLYPDAWLEVATDGSGVQAQEFDVAFPGHKYVAYRRAGGGIDCGHERLFTWPEAITAGDVQGMVRRIEQAMGLVRSKIGTSMSMPARLAAFAAAAVAVSYGSGSSIGLVPQPYWEGQYIYGLRPTSQQVHIIINGHHIEARDDGYIEVGDHRYALPTARPAIQRVALEILQAIGLFSVNR